ncbi:sensor histidine kinase [Faecalicatena contorta]|uniref:sensor histidine kinase n=1 Tax=Faecalicatena contorta TaxID=39482 RepID=UPI001F1D8DE0|nr:sensor histidine kinase [Faecalicatena contorta]MCF2679857.1 sensor histidine kinase [Faecalicatena contorta]
MKLGIKLRGTLLANVLFLLITAAVFERMDYPLWPVLLVILLQMAVMLYVNVAISQPLKSFEEVLDTLSQEESEEAELVRRAGSVPYIAEVEYLIERYSTQRTRRDSAAIFDKQAELTALQSQINPHFLYNTLESIRGQALMDDNFEIAKMVEALGAFFRYSISRKGNLVTLRDEIANINNYMLIQRYRFNNRFSLEIIIDEEDEVAYDFQIPRLIIQPVVENAIFHGLEEKLEGGRVIIEVIVTEKHLIITISDNGKGIPKDELSKINARIHSPGNKLEDAKQGRERNTGIALPNIHKRIQLLFGEEYGVNVYSTVGQGTDVEITVPADYGRSEKRTDEERNTAGK